MPTTKKKRQQTATKREQSKRTKTTTEARSVLYEELDCVIHSLSTKDGPITVDKAKDLLGWKEEVEKEPFGNKHVAEISRAYGVKVRCDNNVSNRPIYSTVLNTLKQEILRGRWKFNGEPIIVGVTGLILNGQHTLLALILAAKEWAEHPERWPHWSDGEPNIEKIVAYGVTEDDDTVNTMDTCKPRTLADVIYRADYFKDLPAGCQKQVARMTQYAIIQMWRRSGTHVNHNVNKPTHAEHIAFLNRHPKLLEAVRHIYEEDGDDRKLSKYITPGYASAALFLMASSSTNPETYYTAEHPSEEQLDFSNWDRACEFFVELGSGAGSLKAVREEIAKLIAAGSSVWLDRWAVFAKAWEAYQNGETVTPKTVQLDFVVRDDERHLTEEPMLGGIDVGEDGFHFMDPPKEEIKKRAAKLQEKKNGKSKVANRKGEVWSAGDRAWCHPSDGSEPFFCTLSDEPFETQGGPIKVFVDAEDGDWEVDVAELSLAQFEKVA